MKIALVSPYDYPYPGGVQQHISNLEKHFRQDGHTVRIIAPSSSDKEELRRDGIYKVGNVVSIPANGSIARITLSPRLSWRVKQILDYEQFDIIHLHEPLVPALTLTVLHHSQTVNIGTFHCYVGSPYNSIGLAHYLAKPVLQRFFSKLYGKIAVSPAAYSFISRHFPGNYEIIPNGIDVESFGDHVKPFERFQDGKLNILFLGRLEKRKGFKFLLRAFPRIKAEVPEARLIVVGAYDAKTQARYEAYVQRHNIEDVVFAGWASAEEKARYYKSAHVFCSPAVGGESFGIVLLEAMAAGIPVVASDIPGYRSVVRHEQEGLLVPPGNDEALAMALIRLLRMPRLRDAISEQGIVRAAEYSWATVSQRVLGYYELVLRNSGVTPLQPNPIFAPGLLPEI